MALPIGMGGRSGFTLNIRVKELFFDRAAVKSMMDRRTRAFLGGIGAWTRTVAQRSIRKRRGYAPPGQPPHSHAGWLRRGIIFALEPARRSVVIGPMRLRGRSPYGETTVPEVLEYGGTVARRDKRRGRKVYRYEPRPYMRPALEKALARQDRFWSESIQRAGR